MTAVACLRVSLDANRTDVPVEALGPLVAKYTGAFLEVRWAWPRSFRALNHYCYLLTDPRAAELDTVEIARLSDELEQRLFGTGDVEGVTLLLFEGPDSSIHEFKGLSEEALTEIAANRRAPPAGGRLSRIMSDGSLTPVPPDADPPAPRPDPGPPPVESLHGIYFIKREQFFGDLISCAPPGAAGPVSISDGREHYPEDPEAFDNSCVVAALGLVARHDVRTPVYLPVSFSKLMRPSQRASYAELLHVLPPSLTPMLAAAVYDVPRGMTFQALQTVRQVLGDHVSGIDLQTSDPGFEVLQMTTRAVRSVTLVLPDARPEMRLAALRRFGERTEEFNRRKIWPGLTNVRSAAERTLAKELGVPFIAGPGVSAGRDDLLGGTAFNWTRLPAAALAPVLLDVAEPAAELADAP